MGYSRDNRIEIEKGIIYDNRSRKYLWPALNSSGFSNGIKDALSKFQKLAIGIADYNYNNATDYIEDTLYVLFDINGRQKYNKYINLKHFRARFAKFLKDVKAEKGYVTDYAYDDVMLGHQHMVVFKLGIQGIVEKFVEGKYSEMYTPEQIDQYINKTKVINGTEYITDTYKILAKDPTYNRAFQQKVSQEFNTMVSVDEPLEYDFPPFLNEEIFNYV